MLIDLVISEELDPWEVDIEEITNKFLERVKEVQRINLRRSGKTVLASSILLRMKSEAIFPRQFEIGMEGDEEWNGGLEEGEAVIPELRMPTMRHAEQKTTLYELIDALQIALGEEAIRRSLPKKTRTRGTLKLKLEEEGIEERIEKVYRRLEELSVLSEIIKFSDLVSSTNPDQIVENLVSVLYLDSQRRIELWQEEVFDEIFISLR